MPPDRQSEGLETRQHGVRSWLSGELGKPPTGRILPLSLSPSASLPGLDESSLPCSAHTPSCAPHPETQHGHPGSTLQANPWGPLPARLTHNIHQHTRQV